jgi:hypothetical protein
LNFLSQSPFDVELRRVPVQGVMKHVWQLG